MLKPYSLTISADMDTPITLYKKYVGNEIGFLFESKDETKGRYSIIGKNPIITIKSKDKQIVIEKEGGGIYFENGNPLKVIKKYMKPYLLKNDTSIPFIGGAVGTVSYDIIRHFEKLPVKNEDTLGLPEVHQMFIKETLVYDHLYNKIYCVVLEEDSEKGRDKAKNRLAEIKEKILTNQVFLKPLRKRINNSKISSNVTAEDFINKVNKIKDYIKEGDVFQTVLSQRVTIDQDMEPFEMYRHLRGVNPSAYLFYINFGSYQVLGSSPEMLVELRGDLVKTCPIAGTKKRGKTELEDKKLSIQLSNDEKEIAEHVMLVDLGRNDMGRVSKIGTVSVTKFKEVNYYSHVMHLVSLVEGEKVEGLDMFDVLPSFLPAGTLSGAPKIRAMEIIEELENCRRGIYGGAIGYFGFDGNMDMCIAIRTMIVQNGKVHLQAGAGIVADSIPEKEYEETWNKLRALLHAIGIKGGNSLDGFINR